ncbi:Ufm1-specific protease 1 [Apodemus speciosus]|uniref:Ufm1-specific protease 1 n=1 Tax=Apodemus speciosus TaxID=105296 RepID=A0ABQ0ETD9_APOSI
MPRAPRSRASWRSGATLFTLHSGWGPSHGRRRCRCSVQGPAGDL